MNFQVQMCCLCLKTNQTFSHLKDSGWDNIKYYDKIIAALPKLLFDSAFDYLLCTECCDIIDSTYEFTIRCVKNLKTFKEYRTHITKTLSSLNNQSCNILVKLSNVENILPDNDDCINLEDTDEETDNVGIGNKNEFDNSKNVNEVEEPNVTTEDTNETDEAAIKIEDSDNDNLLEDNISDDETTQVKAANTTLKESRTYYSNQQNASDDISEELDHEMSGEHFLTRNYQIDETDIINNEESEMSGSFTDEGSTSSRPYNCDLCNKRFLRPHDLKRHKLLHSDERPFECDLCDKSFKTKSTLVTHKITHTGVKPLTCDVCGIGCVSLSYLTVHRRVHTGEKPFVCNFCGVAFAQKGNLKSHRLTHTGERPFECDICLKRFISSTGLARHRPIHTGEKPYGCTLCEKMFSSTTSLSTHKRRTHKIRKMNQ